MVGVRVKARADDRERIVLFASAPTGAVPAAATVRYHVVPTGPGRHHIFDLQPRQPFQVSVSADPRAAQGQEITVAPAGPGVTLISSDTGALTFDLVAGQVRPVP